MYTVCSLLALLGALNTPAAIVMSSSLLVELQVEAWKRRPKINNTQTIQETDNRHERGERVLIATSFYSSTKTVLRSRHKLGTRAMRQNRATISRQWFPIHRQVHEGKEPQQSPVSWLHCKELTSHTATSHYERAGLNIPRNCNQPRQANPMKDPFDIATREGLT